MGSRAAAGDAASRVLATASGGSSPAEIRRAKGGHGEASSRPRHASCGRTRGAPGASIGPADRAGAPATVASVDERRETKRRTATRAPMTPRTIAIDGPAGAGKSTIGALVAERLGYLFLDTGGMYRAVALAAKRRGIDPDDADRLATLAREARVLIGPPTKRDGRAYTVLLDGDDVTWAIREADIDRTVSQVARVPAVRDAMVEQQRDLAKRGRLVMVGRDIGTVVLPKADRKIYLTASAAERAKRREEELASRGEVRPRQELLQEILRRDKLDSERAVAPLKAAEDAVVVQTDGLSVGQALDKVLGIITTT